MSGLEREVKSAQRRLWLDRWLRLWGWSLLWCAGAWMLLIVADRLFALRIPMKWAAGAAGGLSLAVSCTWFAMTREATLVAARALDAAAGLRERVSTSLALEAAGPGANSEDPFAQAVLADAENRLAGVRANRLIRVRWSRSMTFGATMVLAAALTLLLPEFDILKKNESRAQAEARLAALNRVRSTVAKPVTAMQQIADKQGDEALKSQVEQLERALERDPNADAEAIRREAAKQLDKLQEALRKKTEEDRFRALDETKKQLNRMGKPEDPKGQAAKLMESLAAGDFDSARDQAKKLQEELAKRAKEGSPDAEKSKALQKQLDELAEKLKKAAEDKQTEREMKNAGLTEEQVKKVLDTLAKKDKQQLEKLARELAEQLKDKGITEEQIKQMAQKAQQRQQASQQCKSLGDQMGQAGRQLEAGDTEAAASEMGEAAEMLSEMEQVEQAMNEMDAQMSQLADARDELSGDGDNHGDGEGDGEGNGESGKCGSCNGTGFRKDGSLCGGCEGTGSGKGSGSGKGRPGRGHGSGRRNIDDTTDVDFVNKKDKGKLTKAGQVIGQQFIKGEQLKGKSDIELVDVSRAAEVDAADAINKDRIPRAYRKGVKNYFDRLGDGLGKRDTPPKDDKPKDAEKKP
ncbi:hypothetical protein RAS2_14250 [Phycisphaerae bacterium RAS2]|nr:hypothetical protein RAS2_14250 [Phycisphaerae bacterium RAS2]